MKYTLAENMRRFGTKNLTEQAAYIPGSSELEAALEKRPELTIKFNTPSPRMFKLGADGYPLVDQYRTGTKQTYSARSGNYMDILATAARKHTLDAKGIQKLIYNIDKNDYTMALWVVRYSKEFRREVGANYKTVCDFVFSKFPINQRQPGADPITAVRNYFYDPAAGEAIARHLSQFNTAERALVDTTGVGE